MREASPANAPVTLDSAHTGPDAIAEVSRWLASFLTRGHPELGRKGAVCPFMEQSLRLGRAAVSAIDVIGPRGAERLESTARSALSRLGGRPIGDDIHNCFILIPTGEDADTCRDLVVRVQERLKGEAVAAGRMIGEFFPGHPMPGIRSASFRPLASPRPILAVRSMVVTDLLFLTFPGISGPDRRAYLAVWQQQFGERAGEAWTQMYEAALAEAMQET